MPRLRSYWIRLDDGVHDHPKIVHLALACGVSREAVVGHLTRLWLWCRRYRPTGFLGGLTDEILAEASGWRGDPARWRADLRGARLTVAVRHGEALKGWTERNAYLIREQERKLAGTPSNHARLAREPRASRARQDIQDVQDRKTPPAPPQPEVEAEPAPPTTARVDRTRTRTGFRNLGGAYVEPPNARPKGNGNADAYRVKRAELERSIREAHPAMPDSEVLTLLAAELRRQGITA